MTTGNDSSSFNVGAYLDSHKACLAEAIEKNTRGINAVLIKLGISRFHAEYSGGGDSCDDMYIKLYDKDDKLIEDGAVYASLTKHCCVQYSSESQTYKILETEVKLSEALSDIVFSWIDKYHSGWENNEGGYGNFYYDVKTATVKLNHTEYYTQSTDYEYISKLGGEE